MVLAYFPSRPAIHHHGWLVLSLFLVFLATSTRTCAEDITGLLQPAIEQTQEQDQCPRDKQDREIDFKTDDNRLLTTIFVSLWHDLNNNGYKDGGEPPLPDVQVELSLTNRAGGQPVFVGYGVSNAYGEITFGQLSAGSYRVSVVPGQEALTGLVAGENTPSTQNVTLSGGQAVLVFMGFVDQPPEITFTPAHTRTSLPGLLVRLSHSITSSRTGEASITTRWLPGGEQPPVTWPVFLYPIDCDRQARSLRHMAGPLTPAETLPAEPESLSLLSLPIKGPLMLQADQPSCLQAVFFVPSQAPYGTEAALELSVGFSLEKSSGSDVPVIDSRVVDYLVVEDNRQPGLSLRKQVTNGIRGGTASLFTNAYPGEQQEYTITYRNIGTENLSDLEIFTETPPLTHLVQPVQCPEKLPEGLSDCEILVFGSRPNGPDYTGSMIWRFTGVLQPGESGLVSYIVEVD